MRNVLASAVESEIAALFRNGQKAAILRTIFLKMKHPQPPIPIKTDNSTTSGIANKTVIPRKTRSMDMKYYWIRDRVTQQQFIIYWKPGSDNNADYFSKHHPPSHHQRVRQTYVIFPLSPNYSPKRGCIILILTLPITANNEDT